MDEVPLRYLPSILLAALASLSFGLVLGPEAPLVALGLGLGLVAGRVVRDGATEVQILALAGGYAALSTVLGGPLTSALLLFEVVPAEGSAGVLVALIIAKGLAYGISLGAGFRGGPVFPAVALGVALAVLAENVLPGLALTPAVIAGVAAGATAAMRAPFFEALLSTLLAGATAAETMPIAILAAVTGWLVALALQPCPASAPTAPQPRRREPSEPC